VPLGLHILEDLRYAAVRIDHEGRAQDSHVFPAEHGLLTPDAIPLGDGMIRVGNEREGEVVFLLELLMLLHGVRADPNHRCFDSLEPREGVAKLARLEGSARGVVFGIEVQHDCLAAKRLQRDSRATVGLSGEVGSAIAFFEHSISWLAFESKVEVSQVRFSTKHPNAVDHKTQMTQSDAEDAVLQRLWQYSVFSVTLRVLRSVFLDGAMSRAAGRRQRRHWHRHRLRQTDSIDEDSGCVSQTGNIVVDPPTLVECKRRCASVTK